MQDSFVTSEDQQKLLNDPLAVFPDVLISKPGRTDEVQLSIETGQSPISHPYRVAPRWKTSLKEEIDCLPKDKIIVPCESPWASPVSKKDGSLRLCVEFRAVNAVTQPDPYQMPHIEEILDTLGSTSLSVK